MSEKAILFRSSKPEPVIPYVNRHEGEKLAIPSGYVQTFLHSKKITRTTERIALLKVFSELPIGAEKAAIEIIEFLFRFKCASEEQLEEMISWKGLGEEYVAQILGLV